MDEVLHDRPARSKRFGLFQRTRIARTKFCLSVSRESDAATSPANTYSRRRTSRYRVSALLAVVAVFCSLVVVGHVEPAQAQDGTVLRQITADVPNCSVSTGIAFDGSRLLLSCNYNNQIYAVSPQDGSRLATYTISGLPAIGAMAWDRGRNVLWACGGFAGDDHALWTIDLARSAATFKFATAGCVDGLAYDGADDTIWSGADVASTVQHYTIGGVLLASLSVSGKIGGCGKSGIAVGGPFLFVANNGCSQIYKASKDLSAVTLFGTYPQRLEDLECDDITFAGIGKAAIWSKDAYDNILNAFELNPGDCGYGGFSAAITLSPATGRSPLGEGHRIQARVTDLRTGQPVANTVVTFSVLSGPSVGVGGTCFQPGIPTFPPPVPCATNADGTVWWLYDGRGVGHDTIEGAANVPTSTFPITQRVSTTVTRDWEAPARYVALGDSFAAGEGLRPYAFPPPGSSAPSNRCHRSTKAYPTQLQPQSYGDTIYSYSKGTTVQATFDFVACSGATTRNVIQGAGSVKQHNEPATQLDQTVVDADTNLATITIGGNDAGFAEVVRFCALHACLDPEPPKFKDGKTLAQWLPAKIDSLKPALVRTYQQARNKMGASDTTIVVLGYPQLFPATVREQTCGKLGLWLGEQDFLRVMTTRMNTVIAQAAAAAGVLFAPMESAFAGHEICGNSGEWINATTQGSVLNLQVVGDGSFHPNAAGQRGFASALRTWFADKTSEGLPLLATGLPANPAPIAATSQLAAATPADSLGTVGRLLIDTVPGSPGPCADDLRLYSPGQSVRLTGSEFAPGADVLITYGIGDSPLRTDVRHVTANASGNIDATITIPPTLPLHTLGDLQANGNDLDPGTRMLLEVFTLEQPSPGCDSTPPAVDVISPVDLGSYVLNQNVLARYSCSDQETGVATCQGTVPNGSPIDTATVGEHVFTVSATDVAGNLTTKSVTYTVRYSFVGFQPPVDNAPVVNVVNAGSTVPIKWAISDFGGIGINNPTAVLSVTSTPHACTPGAPQGSVETSATTTGLRSLGNGNWIYNWQTAGYAGTCRTLELRLDDGSVHEALFRFR